MRNITVTVDDSVYHGARQFAAKWDTSVSALVSQFLVSMPLIHRMTQEANAIETKKANAIANASRKEASSQSNSGRP